MSQKFLQAKKTKLAGSGITATATSIILDFFTTPNGTEIETASLGTTNYGTLEPGTDKEEIISFTGVTQNDDGTATLTGVTRGLKFVSDYTADTSLRQAHAGGTIFVVSNNPQLYEDMVSGVNDETITGKYTFPEGGDASAPKSGTSYSEPTDDLEYAAKKYVDDIAIAGSPKATEAVYGIAKLSTAAVSATEPIVVGDNDGRIPTTDEKAALAGSSGTPASDNVFITEDDVKDDGTASKVVRLDASSQATIAETPTADAHASSKKYVDDLIAVISNKIGIITTDVTLTNTTDETTLAQISIPANTLGTANGVKLKMFISDFKMASTSSINLKLKYGSTTLATATLAGGSVGNMVGMSGILESCVLSDGTTGTQEGSIYVNLGVKTQLADNINNMFLSETEAGDSSEDSTGALNLTITATWSVASTANSITMSNTIIEKIF